MKTILITQDDLLRIAKGSAMSFDLEGDVVTLRLPTYKEYREKEAAYRAVLKARGATPPAPAPDNFVHLIITPRP